MRRPTSSLTFHDFDWADFSGEELIIALLMTKLRTFDPEAAATLAKLIDDMDEEGMRLWGRALDDAPPSVPLSIARLVAAQAVGAANTRITTDSPAAAERPCMAPEAGGEDALHGRAPAPRFATGGGQGEPPPGDGLG